MDKTNLADIIDKAIQREIEAHEFYMKLCGIVEDKNAKDTLAFLAAEEKKHREFLEKYRGGKIKGNSLRMKETVDYKIAEFIDAPDIKKNMNTAEVYLVAAHREENSYNFYRGLAGAQPDGEVKSMLMKMANEERGHKEKVEYLYANSAYPQTEGG